MDIVTKFFETFKIEPCIKKGEKYFTTHMRYAEVTAKEDLPWVITPEKILELESLLSGFELTKDPTYQDEYWYCYKSKDRIGKVCLDRLSALLEFFIEYSEYYENGVREVFSLR